MGFTPASPVETKPAGTGFTIALLYSARQQKVRITITEAAQLQYFGGSLDGKRLDIMIGRDADRGRLKIVQAAEGAFEVRKSTRGSVFVAMNRWNLLPSDKRPTQSMQVAFQDSTGLVLMVPDYQRVPPAENNAGRGVQKAPPMA